MSSAGKNEKATRWRSWVEKFEEIVVATLALLLVVTVATILAAVAYLFVVNLGTIVKGIENVADVQRAGLRAFSGILLVLLGLELLDTVKVYFWEHRVRVEVILLVGLIAMGRHVLEIDLHEVNPSTMFGFSSLILALAISYFFVRRASRSAIRFTEHESDGGIASEK